MTKREFEMIAGYKVPDILWRGIAKARGIEPWAGDTDEAFVWQYTGGDGGYLASVVAVFVNSEWQALTDELARYHGEVARLREQAEDLRAMADRGIQETAYAWRQYFEVTKRGRWA